MGLGGGGIIRGGGNEQEVKKILRRRISEFIYLGQRRGNRGVVGNEQGKRKVQVKDRKVNVLC